MAKRKSMIAKALGAKAVATLPAIGGGAFGAARMAETIKMLKSVREALEGPGWRTMEGLMRDTGLSDHDIVQQMDQMEDVEKGTAVMSSGRILVAYTLSKGIWEFE